MTTSDNKFDKFINGPIAEGDVKRAMLMWRETYPGTRQVGGTALHWACWCIKGDRKEMVRALLSRGCDKEAETASHEWGWRRGRRPLHLCATMGNRDAMLVLLEAECCLTALTPEGETPLQIAEMNNNRECASMLRAAIQARGLLNVQKVGEDATMRAERVLVTESWSTSKNIAKDKKLSDIREMISKRRHYLTSKNEEGLSRLHIAVIENDPDRVEYLIKNFITADESHKVPPQLIDVNSNLSKASSNIPQMPITNHETIYSVCLKYNRTIYPCLIESLDPRTVNRPDGNNNSLLHLAAVYLMPDLCSQLIAKAADVNSKNDSECTPLLELLKRHSEGNIKEMETSIIKTVNVLIDGGASLDVEDIDGCSVLEKATVFQNEKLLLALIQKHEHINRIKKPQWLAWLNEGYFSVVKEVIPLIHKSLLNEWITRDLIKERLLDSNISLAKTLYDHGSYDVKIDVVETMLYRAAVIGDKNFFKRIIKDDIFINSCLDGGESLLHSLIRERKIEFIQLVIRSTHGSWFIEKKGSDKKLPLHVCIENDYWEVVDQLIAETTSVNEQDNNGDTALSLLLSKISTTDEEITIGRLMAYVKLLINKSADIYLVNQLNRTVITYCTKSDLKQEIESFFQTHQPRQETVATPQTAQPSDVERANICSICGDEPRNCALNCGHVFCMTCTEKTVDCYFCRKRITDRQKLFI